MRKKLIFGLMLVLTLLLLMPSIPAIQRKIIENKAYNDFIGEINDFNLKEICTLDWIKHPILYTFFKFVYLINCMRSVRLVEIAKPPGPDVKYPLLYLYAYFIGLKGAMWFGFWF